MRAAILSVGDELVLGEALDTNSQWIAHELLDRGVDTVEHRTVGDDRAAIAHCAVVLAAQVDLLFITGGLGPTQDDLTREALGDVMNPGEPLHDLAPRSAQLIANTHGTAPGLRTRLGGCEIASLPGPPREMRPMFGLVIDEMLAKQSSNTDLGTASINACGIGESHAAGLIEPLMRRQANPHVGTTVSGAIVRARVRARGESALAALPSLLTMIESAWEPWAFGRGEVTLALALGSLLRARGESFATAESCTAGSCGALATEVAGSSAWFKGGIIAYSNEVKQSCLGVTKEILAQHGAVSAQVATAMACGVAERLGTAWGVSITGIAGPAGGTATKPVGTVFIGVHGSSQRVRHIRIRGDRELVRQKSALLALQSLRLELIGRGATPLQGEVGIP